MRKVITLSASVLLTCALLVGAGQTAALAAGPPAAPAPPVAVGGVQSASVSWVAPVDNGSPITAYRVQGFVGFALVKDVTFNSVATTQTVTGLTGGQSVRFKVAAINANGTGPFSGASNLVAIAVAPPPAAPAPPVAVGGVQSASVSWVAPVDNGSPITAYRVQGFVGFALVKDVTFNSVATTQTVTGLTGGQSVRFKVAAINANGTGPFSGASNLVAIAVAPPPAAPAPPVAVGGVQSASVSWVAPVDNGSPITAYRVQGFVGFALVKDVTFNSVATTQTVTGLTGGQSVRFKVAAINANGTGPFSGASNLVAIAVAPPPAAPAPPVAVGGVQSASVSWVAPVDNGSPITAYRVQGYVGFSLVKDVTFNSVATTQTVTGLTGGQSVRFKVAAINANGTGPFSTASNQVAIS